MVEVVGEFLGGGVEAGGVLWVAAAGGEESTVGERAVEEGIVGGGLAGDVGERVVPTFPFAREDEAAVGGAVCEEPGEEVVDAGPELSDEGIVGGGLVVFSEAFDRIGGAVFHDGVDVPPIGAGVGLDHAVVALRECDAEEEVFHEARVAVEEVGGFGGGGLSGGGGRVVDGRAGEGDAGDVVGGRIFVHPFDAFAVGAIDVGVFAEELDGAGGDVPGAVEERVAGGEAADAGEGVEAFDEVDVADFCGAAGDFEGE